MWREAERREVWVDLPQDGRTAGVPLGEILRHAGLEENAADSDAGLLVIVNGAVVSSKDQPGLRVRDGDEVSLQIMISGG